MKINLRYRKVLPVVVLFMTMFFSADNVSAQKKEVINGRTYYVHIVKKGHTLYGISKQYAVDLNLLYQNNSEASTSGLTIGQRILIPFSDVKPKEYRKAPKYERGGLVHKVAKKETLYSISKKYGVDINELIARNPGADSGIVKGDVIIIPVEKIEGQEGVAIQPAEELKANQHLVEKSETIYGIAKEHDVTIEALNEANDDFPEGLKVGIIINVPNPTNAPDMGDALTVDSTEVYITGEVVEELNVGLLLPFSFSLIDTTSLPNSGGNSYRMTDIALEFYRGVQMALEDQKGMNVNLFVYDISKEEAGVKRFLAKKEVAELDLVIGPLHGSSFGRISKALKSNGVHFVSPLTKSSEVIQTNPYCSKIQSSNLSHMDFIAEKTWERFNTTQLIVIDSEIPKDKPLLDEFVAAYTAKSDGKKPTIVKLSKYNQVSIKDQMMKDIPNMIVIPSTNKPFVSGMFTRLNDKILKDYTIEIYGIEPWLKYDNISVDQKNKWKLRISSTKYYDYESEATTKYLKKYYKKYSTIPVSDGYGILAYDIANFYMDGVYTYGKVFLEHLDQERVDGLFTGFDFRKVPGGGWENQYKFILRYDSFDLIKE